MVSWPILNYFITVLFLYIMWSIIDIYCKFLYIITTWKFDWSCGSVSICINMKSHWDPVFIVCRSKLAHNVILVLEVCFEYANLKIKWFVYNLLTVLGMHGFWYMLLSPQNHSLFASLGVCEDLGFREDLGVSKDLGICEDLWVCEESNMSEILG